MKVATSTDSVAALSSVEAAFDDYLFKSFEALIEPSEDFFASSSEASDSDDEAFFNFSWDDMAAETPSPQLQPLSLPLSNLDSIFDDTLVSKPKPMVLKKRKRSVVAKVETVVAPKAKKPKKKRPTLTPEERARRKHERMLARRERKNIREKKRRINVNNLFCEITKMLGLPDEHAKDKSSVLASALASIRSLREEEAKSASS